MNKKHRLTPLKAALASLLAAGFMFGGVQTTRAALTVRSDYIEAEAGMQRIAINLVENGSVVSDKGTLTLNKPESEDFKYGKKYDEELAVSVPSTSIDQYVRVIVTKYWKVDPGKTGKLFQASPESIHLYFPEGNSGWVSVGNGGQTTTTSGEYAYNTPSKETTILYYKGIVGSGETTPPFCSAIQADGELKLVETREEDGQTVYIFDGMEFVIEVEAQGVQTHNAKDAITSAWGSEAAAIINPAEG